MLSDPTISSALPHDDGETVAWLLRLLHPIDPTATDLAFAASCFASHRTRIAHAFHAAGPPICGVELAPQVLALAATAMAIALRWLDTTALTDGPRPAALARRFAALMDAIVGTVAEVIGEGRAALIGGLLAAAKEQTDRHGYEALFPAIAAALADAVTA